MFGKVDAQSLRTSNNPLAQSHSAFSQAEKSQCCNGYPYSGRISAWSGLRIAPLVFILVFLSLFAQSSFANDVQIMAGQNWLLAQYQEDGSYTSSSDTSDSFQSSSEALRTLGLITGGAVQNQSITLGYLDSAPHSTSEYLSRKIINRFDVGQSHSDLVAELKGLSNAQGGFGEAEGFDVTNLDTAIALEALGYSNNGNDQTATAAISFLLNNQKGNGGWRDGGNDESVFLTALAVRVTIPLNPSHL